MLKLKNLNFFLLLLTDISNYQNIQNYLRMYLLISSFMAMYRHPRINSFFVLLFIGLECAGHSLVYVSHFCNFEICLNSSPEFRSRKQVRYRLSHPSRNSSMKNFAASSLLLFFTILTVWFDSNRTQVDLYQFSYIKVK